METLVAKHRNHYYDSSRNQTSSFSSFYSHPSGDFKVLNCRGFQSDLGIPRRTVSSNHTQKSLSSASKSHLDDSKHMKRSTRSSSIQSNDTKSVRSSSISIPTKVISPSDKMRSSSSVPNPTNIKAKSNKEMFDEFCYSELWAGPAYSNSPPPSSVPIPKFSRQPMRTVSLDLPSANSCIDLRPAFNSAPSSPTGAHSKDNPVFSADSATMHLRRILNLDLIDC